MKNAMKTNVGSGIQNLGRWRLKDDLPPDESKESILCWFLDGPSVMLPSAARAHHVRFWQPIDPPPRVA